MMPNKKYSCLIVDDEPPAREILQRYVQQIPMLELSGECSNALQALTIMKEQSIELLFLDIHMPQINGIQLINTLKHAPKIILTTAYEQYAVQAFELNVTDYLLKPIAFERFLKAVMKALPEHQGATPNMATTGLDPVVPNFLYFRSDRKMVKVLLPDILYIEGLKDYVKIQTTTATVITKYTMSALEAMLPLTSFARVHRSFLVALNKIQSFTPEEIDIQGRQIPIGKFYRQQTLRVLNG